MTRVPLRGALVGFGGVAEFGHVPGYARDPRFEIGAVVEPLGAARERAARLLGDASRVYPTLEDCLARERLDFVDVCAPPAFHLPAIEKAVEAGAHVLVEKPLALSPEEAARAEAAARAHDRALVVVHNWHEAPVFRAAREALAAGAVGAPREVEFWTERTEPASGGGASWRLDRKVAGGGILVDHGWHQLYIARALLGGPVPERVRALIETRRWHQASVEDTAHADVTYAGGGVARLRLTWAGETRRTRVVVRGEAGALHIEGQGVQVVAAERPARDWPVAPDAPDDSYHAGWFPRVLEHFAAAVADRAAGAENLLEARLGQAVIDAAYRSGAQGGAEIPVQP